MPAADTEAVRELEQRRFTTLVEGDLAAFRALAHPALAYTHSSGTLDTLDSFVEKCASGYFRYHRIDHRIHGVTVVGDAAVVVGEMRVDLTANGKRLQLLNRSLGVWAREDGGWRLLAHQATARP